MVRSLFLFFKAVTVAVVGGKRPISRELKRLLLFEGCPSQSQLPGLLAATADLQQSSLRCELYFPRTPIKE